MLKWKTTATIDNNNCNWGTSNDLQRLDKGTGRNENRRTSRYHPNYSIVEIGQNTEKSPGKIRRLVVIQTALEKPSANTGVKLE